MVSASQFERCGLARRIAPIGILLIIAVIGAAARVHSNDLTGSTCVVCVSAQTSAPTTIVATQILLVALTAALILRELQAPTFEAARSLFIRTPPMA